MSWTVDNNVSVSAVLHMLLCHCMLSPAQAQLSEVIICTLYGPNRVLCGALQRDHTASQSLPHIVGQAKPPVPQQEGDDQIPDPWEKRRARSRYAQEEM